MDGGVRVRYSLGFRYEVSRGPSAQRKKYNMSGLRTCLIGGTVVIMALSAACEKAVEGLKQATKEAAQAAAADRTRENLKALGLAFHSYHDAHKQFPESWEALVPFAQQQGLNVEALTELRDAGCVINGWGLKLRDITIGSSNFALAYLPQATQQGGPVLHADGAVIPLSADDLQQELQNQKNL